MPHAQDRESRNRYKRRNSERREGMRSGAYMKEGWRETRKESRRVREEKERGRGEGENELRTPGIVCRDKSTTGKL